MLTLPIKKKWLGEKKEREIYEKADKDFVWKI